MAHADHTRDPWCVLSCFYFITNSHCGHAYSPWVILNDFGGAFAMGAVGGGIWHGIKGARNSPRVRTPPLRSFLPNRSVTLTPRDHRVSALLALFPL